MRLPSHSRSVLTAKFEAAAAAAVSARHPVHISPSPFAAAAAAAAEDEGEGGKTSEASSCMHRQRVGGHSADGRTSGKSQDLPPLIRFTSGERGERMRGGKKG